MSNRTSKMVGAGLAPMTAAQIAGDLQSNVTAAGTTQGTATSAYGDNVVVTNCAAGAGIILSGNAGFAPGDDVAVINQSANAVNVYPPLGGIINGQAANAPYIVAGGSATSFRCIGGNSFAVFGGGGGGGSAISFAPISASSAGTQVGGTLLAPGVNLVNMAAPGYSVTLPNVVGQIIVSNISGQSYLLVYPPVGGSINSGTTNANASLAANKGALFCCNGLNSYTVAGL